MYKLGGKNQVTSKGTPVQEQDVLNNQIFEQIFQGGATPFSM